MRYAAAGKLTLATVDGKQSLQASNSAEDLLFCFSTFQVPGGPKRGRAPAFVSVQM